MQTIQTRKGAGEAETVVVLSVSEPACVKDSLLDGWEWINSDKAKEEAIVPRLWDLSYTAGMPVSSTAIHSEGRQL